MDTVWIVEESDENWHWQVLGVCTSNEQAVILLEKQRYAFAYPEDFRIREVKMNEEIWFV